MKKICVTLFFFFLLIRFAGAAPDVGYHHDGARKTIAIAGSYQQWLKSIQERRDSDAHGAGVHGDYPWKILTVDKNGDGDFTRVQEAVDSVPENNVRRVLISIRAGLYWEKVTIPPNKPLIAFVGDGMRKSIIAWKDKAYHDNSTWNVGTYLSASVAVDSDDFVAANISFWNIAKFPEHTEYRQAVALRATGDRAIFLDCEFFGGQDTLYDFQGTHYFLNCTIWGDVDFICGNGRSIYENCHLIARGSGGAVVAQKREAANETTGFAFVRCNLTGNGHPLLGRSWGDFSSVTFIKSRIDLNIDPRAFGDFGYPDRKSTAFYGMHECKGRGAAIAMKSGWTTQLTRDEARPYLDRSFINASHWLDPILEF